MIRGAEWTAETEWSIAELGITPSVRAGQQSFTLREGKVGHKGPNAISPGGKESGVPVLDDA